MASQADLAIILSLVDRASANMERIARNSEHMGATITKSIVAAQVAMRGLEMGLHALEGGVQALFHVAEATHKLSIETGLSAERASGLLAVFRQLGMSGDEASRSLGIFSKNLENLSFKAAAGHVESATFAKALTDLGIDVERLIGDLPSMESMLDAVANRFAALEDGPKKTGIAMDLFGRAGKDMIPILNLGAEGLENARTTLAQYGLVLDETGVHKARNLEIGMRTVGLAFEGIGIKLTQMALPALEAFAAGALHLAARLHDDFLPTVGTVAQRLGEIFGETGRVIAGVLDGIGTMFDTMGGVIADDIDSIRGFFVDMGQGFVDVVGGVAKGAESLVNQVFGGSMHGIVEVVGGTLDAVGTMINDFFKTFDTGMAAAFAAMGIPMGRRFTDTNIIKAVAAIPATIRSTFSAGAISIGGLFEGLGGAISRGLPHFPLGAGAGTGEGAGAGGRGGGAGKAGADAAQTAIDGFMEALAAREADMEAMFGKLGAKSASALLKALNEDTAANGAALARAMEDMISAAREVGLDEWRQTGDALAEAFHDALIAKTPETRSAALEMIRGLDQVIKETQFWQEWAKEGEKAAERINKAIADTEERIREAIQALADSRALDAKRAQVDRYIAGIEAQMDADKRLLDSQRENQDIERSRLQEDEDLEAEHQRRLTEIRTGRGRGVAITEAQLAEARQRTPLGFRIGVIGAGADPIAEENKAHEQRLANLEKQRAREDDERRIRNERRDIDMGTDIGRAERLKGIRLALEFALGIERGQLEDTALAKQITALQVALDTMFVEEARRSAEFWDDSLKKLGLITIAGDAALDGYREDAEAAEAAIRRAAAILRGEETSAGSEEMGGEMVNTPGPGRYKGPNYGAFGGGYNFTAGSSSGGEGGGEGGGAGLQHGGVVTRTGWAMVHKGEQYSGVGRESGATYDLRGATIYGGDDFYRTIEKGIREGKIQTTPRGR